jgi:magnesium transporter
MTACDTGSAWLRSEAFPQGTVGGQLEEPVAAFRTGTSIAMAVDLLRDLMPKRELNQVYVVSQENRLLGIVAFKQLLFADRGQTLDQVMFRNPYSLNPEWTVSHAIVKIALQPELTYPVCDNNGLLLGQIHTHRLHEQQAFELSGQPGYLVGVDHDEQWASPLMLKFQFRQPWLQIHLFMLFVVGAIVGKFQDDFAKATVLVIFLPVLAGLCRNIGSQSLACTLRGLSLSNTAKRVRRQVLKETWLGLVNGFIIGSISAAGMYIVASRHPDQVETLAMVWVTGLAMMLSCAMAGFLGAAMPLLIRKMGFNPAMAANLVMSGLSDIFCLSLFLLMAVKFAV